MKCTSCGETLPDGSNFCANCGSVLVPPVSQQTESLNAKVPARIANILVQFEEDRGKSDWLTGNQNIVLRKFSVYMQLSDENNKTTASEGVINFKVEFWQSREVSAGFGETYQGYVTRNYFNPNKDLRTNLNDFYMANNDGGKIWYKYEHRDPIEVKIKPGYPVMGQIELWFTPHGSKQKLYKKDFFPLSST